MSNLLFFFSFAIFSKSLLTVLGTLPSPAVNWPWKVPPFGVKLSLTAWITPKNGVTHTFHRPTTTTAVSPALLLDLLRYPIPQEVRTASSPPACCAALVYCLVLPGEPRRCPARVRRRVSPSTAFALSHPTSSRSVSPPKVG